MSYRIHLAARALKSLERIQEGQPAIARRIANAIDRLKTEPYSGKKLLANLSDFFSLRVGQYRIIYSVYEKEILIEIVAVSHRKEVYR